MYDAQRRNIRPRNKQCSTKRPGALPLLAQMSPTTVVASFVRHPFIRLSWGHVCQMTHSRGESYESASLGRICFKAGCNGDLMIGVAWILTAADSNYAYLSLLSLSSSQSCAAIICLCINLILYLRAPRKRFYRAECNRSNLQAMPFQTFCCNIK